MCVEEDLSRVVIKEASKVKREINFFFSKLENKTPISVKEFCYQLPEDWYFTSDTDLNTLAVSRGDKVYHFHLDLDVELDEEEKVIKKIKLRRVELKEVYDTADWHVYVCTKKRCREDPDRSAHYEIFGLYEEGNICTAYTEWGLD
jgi:hypothetical protein